MVHYSRGLQGLMAYADTELVDKLAGSGKAWLVGAAVELLAPIADEYAHRLLNSEEAKLAKIVEGENVDVERIYAALIKQARKGSATVVVKILGPVTLTASDVECLYRYIMGG